MLRYFPDLLPDELIYSTICRYYKHTGNDSIKFTFSELFGSDNHVLSVIDFPSHVDSFIQQVKFDDFYKSEDIIFNFTMLPLFYPFLDLRTQKYSVDVMKKGNSKVLYMKLGVMASSINCLRLLKYCPDCLIEDINTYGEVYLHRSHNLDGVYVCYKHNRFLRTNCPECGIAIMQKNKYQLKSLDIKCINGHYLSAKDDEIVGISLSSSDLEHCLLISKIVYFILNNNFTMHDTNFYTLRNKYIYKLSIADLLTPKGSIRQSEMKRRFIEFYNMDFLKKLNLEIDADKSYCWINVFLNKKYRALHPLKHILFLIFLCRKNEDEIKRMLTDSNDYSLNLFGKPPFPCLNPVADHYLENIIKDFKISICPKTNKPLGIFECSCGFIYTRDCPKDDEIDRYRFKSVKAFGHVWEKKLSDIILNEGGGLRSIAYRMKCDPKTIIRYANKLNLAFCWKNKSIRNYYLEVNQNNNTINKSNELCNQYKTNIQNYIMGLNYPPKKCDIRKLFEREFSYLYKHNKLMLDDLFKKPEFLVNTKVRKCKVDWEKRDSELLLEVAGEIEKILKSDKLIRITINKIGSDLGISYIMEQYLDKLPKTQALIKSSIESVEDFQIRRINTIAERMKNNDTLPVKWKLYRIAGLKRTCSDNVKNEIDKLLENI